MKGKIWNKILEGSSLKELTLPQSLWSYDSQISENAFQGSKLTKITFSCYDGKAECHEGEITYKGKDVMIVCGKCPA